jgi:branched-chain amino acid transport system ATP-binding protein
MTFANQDITSVPPSKIVAMGLVHVPEGRQVFNSLTVFENLLMGIYIKRGEFKKEKKRELLEFVLNLFPILRTREKQVAGTLSGGEQQMLAIARALMSEPKLLLFDEPSMGLSPMVIGNIIEVIRRLNQEVGLTILLVEQNPALGLALSNRTYVLNLGKVIASGNSKEMLMQEDLRKVYLGQTKP